MHAAWTSPYLPVLESGNYTITVTIEEGSTLPAILLIGQILGCLTSALTVDRFGRKNLILHSSLPLTISWILVGTTSSLNGIIIGRFIGGFCGGLLGTVTPMYLAEIADPQRRGLLGLFFPLSIVIGILAINILGTCLPLDTNAYLAGVLTLVFLPLFPWMPESPYFHLIRGDVGAAKKSLILLRGSHYIVEEMNSICEALEEQNRCSGNMLELFTLKSNRKALMICTGRFFNLYKKRIMSVSSLCYSIRTSLWKFSTVPINLSFSYSCINSAKIKVS